MGRPFHPEQGLNRQLLLALRRQPGIPPGALARTMGYDGAVVREALARLAGNDLVRIEPGERSHACFITAEGEAVLRRRKRTPKRVHAAVHS